MDRPIFIIPKSLVASGKGRLVKWLGYVFLGLVSILVAYPFLILVLGSLKNEQDFYTNPIGLPHQIIWNNYQVAWKAARLPNLITNSIIVTLGTVLLTLILGSTAGYGLSRFRFPGRKMIYLSFIALLTVPVQIYIIPLYVIVVRLRLADSLEGLIFPYVAGSLPLAVFLFTTYFDSISEDLADAARIDGCGSLRTFIHIILPLARPIIATVAIFTFVQAWNEFFLALVFIHDPNLQTLPLGLQAFFVNQYQTQFPQLFATLITSIAPIVVLYLVLQKEFIAGLTAGSIK